MTKKLLTCLMAMLLILGLLAGCTGGGNNDTDDGGQTTQDVENEDGDSGEPEAELAVDAVTVRVEGFDRSVIREVAIPITEPFSLVEAGYSDIEPDQYTALHAMITALGNQNVGFEVTSGYVASVDADIDRTGHGDFAGWMFAYNGESPMVSADQIAVSDGDVIILYYCPFYDEGGYHAYFQDYTVTAAAGEDVTLTLMAANVGDFVSDNYGVYGPFGDALIYVNGEATEYTTDGSGQVTLSFEEAGEYVVTAEFTGDADANLLTYTSCTVTVG